MSATDTKTSFFRQSGWMVTATLVGGIFMAAVQVVAGNKMNTLEYGVFISLLRWFIVLSIPAAGLQTTFAQQAAAAVDERQVRQMAKATRCVLFAIFLIWLAMVAATWLVQDHLLALFQIKNPLGLWMTLVLVLGSLWAPVVRGLLQGQQRFFGLGWVMIIDGVGRFAAVVIIIFLLNGQAAGGMAGAALGVTIALLIGFPLIRDTLFSPTEVFDWKPWFCRVIPFTLGTGALCVMQNLDLLFVQSVFPDDVFLSTVYYKPAALIGWALIQFTVPLAAVMFPKVVRSRVRAEKSDALKLTMMGTALLGVTAACACTLFPKLPLRILYPFSPLYWDAAPLVPWFAWCLLPLTLVTVLVNNLLARDQFAIVPWLLLVIVGYFAALSTWGHSFLLVIQILGLFNLIALVLAIWFNWQKASPPVPSP